MQWLDPDFIFQTVLPALNRGLVMSIALIVPSATIGFVLGVLTGSGPASSAPNGSAASGTASPPSSAACRSWCSS